MCHLAPIALFCFNRIDTLILCIESLQLSSESIHSDLIIFSDASRNEKDRQKVVEIRSYIININGFKSIRIIHREQNLGVDFNIIKGIQQMSEEYDRFIIVEDDLIVSNQFLRFMNSGLDHFKFFEKVLTLSAFNYVKIPKNYIWDCFFAERSNPWGWATWSNKIKDIDWDLALKNNFLSNKDEMSAFNKWGSDRSRMLKRTLNGEIKAWDIRLDYYQFKKEFVTAYSCKNFVINNGFNRLDASNTSGYNRFKVELNDFDQFDFHFPDFLPLNPIIKRRFILINSIFKRIITSILKIMNYNNK
jgi:hypothetical protein